MICPECKAEYRSGFTRCADCDVELVGSLAGVRPLAHAAVVVEAPEQSFVCDRLLWKGTDVDFYLSLVAALEGQGVAKLGRALNPISASEMEGGSHYSLGGPEFGVWTSEKDLFLGKWIVSSFEEDLAEEAKDVKRNPEQKTANADDAEDAESPAEWKCVLCGARYADYQPLCPSCGVAVHRAGEVLPPEENRRMVSYLPNANFARALRAELAKLGIPFNHVGLGGGNIFTGTYHVPSYEVSVLNKDYERASEVFARLLRGWEFGEGLKLNSRNEVLRTYWPVRADESWWLPEDLTVEVWEGTHYFRLLGVCMAMREHEMPYTLQIEPPGSAKVFVHPKDEAEAKEIIRQIEVGILME
jgi:hypothetical protein